MKMPLRRMRVRYLPHNNPPMWEASYEPPGKSACYCRAFTLVEMMGKLGDYFAGKGAIRPLRVDERFAQYLRPNERYVGIAGRAALERSEGRPCGNNVDNSP